MIGYISTRVIDVKRYNIQGIGHLNWKIGTSTCWVSRFTLRYLAFNITTGVKPTEIDQLELNNAVPFMEASFGLHKEKPHLFFTFFENNSESTNLKP